MKEATPYRKAHRNNDKLNHLISERRLRLEPKGIDAFTVNDFRSFVCCTNNADAFKITEGDRRFFCLEASDRYSQRAVDEGRCTATERREYMQKLDKTKNDDEVAYAFFRYMMSLDLSRFTVEEVFQTELHKEQKSHNECAVKQFLQAVKCGEYPCRYPLEARCSTQTPYTFTCLQLMAHFREFVHRSGLSSNVDSMKSLGWALKRYPDFVDKFDCKPVKYVLKVDDEVSQEAYDRL